MCPLLPGTVERANDVVRSHGAPVAFLNEIIDQGQIARPVRFTGHQTEQVGLERLPAGCRLSRKHPANVVWHITNLESHHACILHA